MPLIRSFVRKIQKLRSLYWQLLFVTLAFALMVISSGFIFNIMMMNYLRRDAENVLTQTQMKIVEELREMETLMIFIARETRDIIMSGGSPDDLLKYFNDISLELLDKKEGFIFDGIHGYFEAFEDIYIPAPGWIVPDDYFPPERSWYQAAVAANGEITTSPMYRSLRSGEYQVSFVCRIFDYEGEPLGVIAMNVPIHNIADFVADMHFMNDGYGFLVNEQFEVVAHPEVDLIARHIYDIDSGFGRIVELMRDRTSISEVEAKNYMDIDAVFFNRRLENGWNLGIVMPKKEYYRDFTTLLFLLGSLGIVLMAAMYFILIRIDIAKNMADKVSHEQGIQLALMEKLRETDNQTQVMLDAMPLAANFWNRNLKNINTNEEAVKMFSLREKQEYLDRFHDLSPEYQPDGQSSHDKAIYLVQKAFDEGYCRFEWMHKNLEGELLPSEVTLVRVKYKNDYIVAGYTRDLREMYRAVEAEQSSRYKSAFLANMSHEIRTPMNTILGITEIQLQKNSLGADAEEAFGKIFESGNLLLNIINDILDLTKIEAGKLELNPVYYDIPGLISDNVQLSRLRCESKQVSFNLQVDPNTPVSMIGDEPCIKRVLKNILSNAVKYTEKGEITLSIAAEYGQDDENVTLVLRVRDTGQGMTEEQLAKLFDEYVRFNIEVNRFKAGAGLGMSITKRLVDIMNGEILVESKLDEGSVFTVRLPQKRVGNAVCGDELARKLQDLRFQNSSIIGRTQFLREYMPYGKVLIVDDVESNIYVVKGLLSFYGLQIETAASGLESVEKIRNGFVYDIIFMDHMMPGMNGLEAVKIIRDMGYKNYIVALTANAIAGQAGVYLANGFDGFISKPVDSRELNGLLNDFIRDKKPPEVVEAARHEQQKKNKKETIILPVSAQNTERDSELEKFFILDAENFISVLKDIYSKLHMLNEEETESYIIAVHGMKSALANIGEKDLAGIAFKLERAGNERNFAVISNDTPSFMDAIQLLIEKYRPEENDDSVEISNEDLVFLQNKLLDIKAACLLFNKKAVKASLDELKQKTWPRRINNGLDDISVLLLHSAFKKIAIAAENTIKYR